MTVEQERVLVKARENLAYASNAFKDGFVDVAASRAYYSMFYVAIAFLLKIDLRYSSHSGVIAAFGREFCKTGLVPQEFHQFLISAQALRREGDYNWMSKVQPDAVARKIGQAEKFLELAYREIGSLEDKN